MVRMTALPTLALVDGDATQPDFTAGLPALVDDAPPLDDVPASNDGDTRTCENCGTAFHVKRGPGRKPKRCENCRTRQTTRRTDATSRTAGRTSDVDAATAAMQSTNTIAVMLTMGLGLNATAQLLSNDEQFIAECRRAFVTDPKLAARIAKAGSMSGTLVFIGALASFYGPIVFTAAMELPDSRVGGMLGIRRDTDAE